MYKAFDYVEIYVYLLIVNVNYLAKCPPANPSFGTESEIQRMADFENFGS